MIVVGIGVFTDPLVRGTIEGTYRVVWWFRRAFDRLHGNVIDVITAAGNLYVRTAEWTALRWKRWRG